LVWERDDLVVSAAIPLLSAHADAQSGSGYEDQRLVFGDLLGLSY